MDEYREEKHLNLSVASYLCQKKEPDLSRASGENLHVVVIAQKNRLSERERGLRLESFKQIYSWSSWVIRGWQTVIMFSTPFAISVLDTKIEQ